MCQYDERFQQKMRQKAQKYLPCLWALPWKWIIRKKRIVFAIPLLLVFVVVIFFLYLCCFDCTYEEVENIVDDICLKYLKKQAFGNLCSPLCVTKVLRPTSCIPNHRGKDVVFQASYHNMNVIFKSSYSDTSRFDKIFWVEENGSTLYPTLDVFYDMVLSTVSENLNVRNLTNVPRDLSLVKYLWNGNTENFNSLPPLILHGVMNDIWSLIQQPEYLMLKYYENKLVFPKVIGSCGSIYVEEYVKPLENLFLLFYPAWRDSFEKRAKIAVLVIDYLETIENMFPDLHICDVKMGHFGIDSQGRMKFLDMDMVFQKQALVKNMLLTQNCSNNEDCSFLDCLGFCDQETQNCLPDVKNTNFQRVCSNILLGKLAPSYLGLLGLPPKSVSKKLQSLLQKCTSEMDETASSELRKKLKFLLQSILQL